MLHAVETFLFVVVALPLAGLRSASGKATTMGMEAVAAGCGPWVTGTVALPGGDADRIYREAKRLCTLSVWPGQGAKQAEVVRELPGLVPGPVRGV